MTWQPDLFGDDTPQRVVPIKPADSHDLILNVHYAHRIPSITYAYGLIDADDNLEGVVTFGTPPSWSLLEGIAGPDWAGHTIELNRLVLRHNRHNDASRLVGQAVRQLPKPTIVASFADTEQQHHGTVYQACNFYYTGLSVPFTDVVVRGLEHQHHTSYGHGRTVQQMRDEYGAENVYYKPRSRKHRYLLPHASRTAKRQWLKDLRYPIQPYPQTATTATGGTR